MRPSQSNIRETPAQPDEPFEVVQRLSLDRHQLQHQECPQSRMMILCERAVLLEQAADIGRAEKASFSRALRQQHFVGEFLEFATEPVIDGTAEPHFRPVEEFIRQIGFHRRFEQRLGPAMRHVELFR